MQVTARNLQKGPVRVMGRSLAPSAEGGVGMRARRSGVQLSEGRGRLPGGERRRPASPVAVRGGRIPGLHVKAKRGGHGAIHTRAEPQDSENRPPRLELGRPPGSRPDGAGGGERARKKQEPSRRLWSGRVPPTALAPPSAFCTAAENGRDAEGGREEGAEGSQKGPRIGQVNPK